MADSHANFAYSTVATAPSPASSGTSLVVAAADGAKFPAAPFNATVWPTSAQPTTANAEIVRVTAISTDTLTITRTQEATSARTIVIGDQIAATITAKTLTDVEQANSYLTSVDQVVAANTQAIVDDYLELSSSFVYELASGAELVVGDFATPLAVPDQNTNIVVTVADETVPRNSEVIFSDFYELSAPFATEIASSGELQVGTGSDVSAVFPPGYLFGRDQITANVTIAATIEPGTTIISCAPHFFDGALIRCEFFSPLVRSSAVAQVIVCLFEGATQIGRLAFVQTAVAATAEGAGQVGITYFTPTAGYHTYTVTAFATDASGSPLIAAGAGGAAATVPAFIAFTKA